MSSAAAVRITAAGRAGTGGADLHELSGSLALVVDESLAEIVSGRLRGSALVERILAVPFLERDAWVDALLGIDSPPPDDVDLPPGAVPYLPCGVDEILAAIREAPITDHDELVDLGSGLGRVVMLVHLVTGARARGIELQEHLVRRARERAAALGLSEISFVHDDATGIDLDGTVFFLYAPCNGDMLARLIGRMETVSQRHRIVVCAVGVELPGVPWLAGRPTSTHALTIYESTAP